MLKHLNDAPTRPTRVVIIGARGFVGRALSAALAEQGIPVLALSRREVDLSASDAASNLASLLRPDDAVAAVAAVAPVKNPQMLIANVVIVEAMAEALRRQPVAHLLNIGSDAIYADSRKPLAEDSPAAPASLHGVMHVMREIVLADAAGGAPFASLRPTLIYGLHDPHNGYGPNSFRRLAAAGKQIMLFGEGEELRDHIAVEDVAALAVRILLRRSRGTLNAVTGKAISFRDIAELTLASFPGAPPIASKARTQPMPHDGYRAFDISALHAAFPDFSPTPPERGIEAVCNRMKDMN